MRISLQKTLLNRNFLRISALLIGSTLWSIMSGMHYSTITLTVPVCFYNEASATQCDAPEFLTITLQGKKSDLRTIDYASLAAHIDAQTVSNKKQGLSITNKNLFLPSHVKLLHYSPMNFAVETSKE